MKVIEKNGGIFERYSEDDVGEKTRVYWIHLVADGIK
jgi:predicted acetyltransferase